MAISSDIGIVSGMTSKTASTTKPLAVHVMAKPSGAICNLDCTYCFYLEKEKLYPTAGQKWRMSDEALERYVRQYIEAQDVPVVNFAWQGGEPTLMGVDFFRRAVALQQQYANGKEITNALQTNGVLLDDEWGQFLAEHKFLVGVSIDGPREMHDRYRVDRGNNPTFDKVVKGIKVLSRHRVEFNTLTVVNGHNVRHPQKVYRFLKRLGSRYMQFIPIVERAAQTPSGDGLTLVAPEFGGEASVTPWSVKAEDYGRFLTTIFDEWVRNDVGEYFIQMFEVTLSSWVGRPPGLCVFAETCGDALVIEHNGDLYSCDHFVYPDYRLGNVEEQSIREMVTSPKQRKFGQDKKDTLPEMCRQCEFRFACNGGCPKHRFIRTPDGEPGLNYLCAGYKRYFGHVAPYMQAMAEQLRNGRSPAAVMEWARSSKSRR